MKQILKVKEFENIPLDVMKNGILSYLEKHEKNPPYFGTGHGRFISKPQIWSDVSKNFKYKFNLSNSRPKNDIKYSFQNKKNLEIIKCLSIQLAPQLKSNGVYEVPWKLDRGLVDFQDFSQYLGHFKSNLICREIFKNLRHPSIVNPFEEKIPIKYLEEIVQKHLNSNLIWSGNKMNGISNPMLKLGAFLYDKKSYKKLGELEKLEFCEDFYIQRRKLKKHLTSLI